VAFRRDDRLAKTLLLSALAPEVESFKGMTVNKLAALNHGTIRTPVPGREGQIVLDLVRKWAGEIGQIRLGDEAINPSIAVQLTGVDTEGIIAQAASEDNPGNRVRNELPGVPAIDGGLGQSRMERGNPGQNDQANSGRSGLAHYHRMVAAAAAKRTGGR
jgi:hypothetical protein